MRNFVPETNLPSIDEALDKFLSVLPPKGRVSRLDILKSVGKITSSPVVAEIDYPPFSRSTVDGFAIVSSSTPGKFKKVNKISIGEWKDIRIKGGEAVEVDTGSPIPSGADAVVKIEETEVDGSEVIINKRVRFGTNVAWVGSDIPRGSIILDELQEVTPEDVGSLASLGINRVEVFDSVKVYVIATGDELVSPGSDLPKGKIYESNVHFLLSKLTQMGCEVVNYEVLPDNKEVIRNAIMKASDSADLIITTGGTSAGEKDYVHQIIREEGKIIVQGINVKPGKPTILGEIKGKPIFGLSGNIVATIFLFDRLVEKYIGKLNGKHLARRYTYNGEVEAISILPIQADKFRTTMIPVFLFKKGQVYFALPVPTESYMVGTFASSDGFVMLQAGKYVEEGEKIKVFAKALDTRPVLIGEEDPKLKDLNVRKIFLGSVPACAALKFGIGDILVISDLVCGKDLNEYQELKRWILVNGKGDEIGYNDWIGMSKLVNEPAVKLKSPATASFFLGKAKVIAPEGYIEGEKLVQEKLKLVIRDKQFSKGIFSEG
ncbi:MAG: molybdopterin-binding protein [Metallosphaera sp.]